MSKVTFPITGNAYSDDGSTNRDMLNGGHTEFLLPMLQEVVDTAKVVVDNAGDSSGASDAAAASAAAAAEKALQAAADRAAAEDAAAAAHADAATVHIPLLAPNPLKMLRVNAAGAAMEWIDIGASDGSSLIGIADGSKLVDLIKLGLNKVVDSIAALRALDHTVFQRAFVAGYYAPHDGGGGSYQYDANDNASADNGGTIIVAADGARWKMRVTSSLSPRQFGVKGDGSAGDQALINAAIAAAVSSAITLQIDDNMQLPQMTVTGTLRMVAKGKITCNYNGANGAWIRVPPGADNSFIEFAEIDFNSNGVMGVQVQAGFCTVLIHDAHNLQGQPYAVGNRQGAAVSEGPDNVIYVVARDFRKGTSDVDSTPRVVTTDVGSTRNVVTIKAYQTNTVWIENGTDNTADYVLCDSVTDNGIYNLSASVNMKCRYLQYVNSKEEAFVLEGTNPHIGKVVMDGWAFPGIQGCRNAAVDHIHLLPPPDGTPSNAVLRSRDGNTTADIRIGRITGSLIIGSVANQGALFQFLAGTVNYVLTDGIDLNVIYAAASASIYFVYHAAGSNVELGDVRLRFNDAAAQPGTPLAWQIPSGATVRIRKWDLDPKSYNYIALAGINSPNALLPVGQAISTNSITNPSTSSPPGRIYFGTVAPTSGTWNRGDTVLNSFPATGNAIGWRCAAAGSPGTWRMMGQNGVTSGSTAARPTASTMGAPDDASWAGSWYRDTTLGANGKPIMWTGTQWVDATGAAV